MSSDFKELLCALGAHGVRYLLVGGYAVIEYTEPRFTKDLDLWIAADRANAEAVYRALAEFGAPMLGATVEDFAIEGGVFQIGISPFRVDILMSIDGVAFEDAWPRRGQADFGGVPVPVISRRDLIANKIAAGRPQDRRDARLLARAEQVEHQRSAPMTPPDGGRGRDRSDEP
ncbi:MAG: nucleotidyltransferase [Chthonomonadales bacterium]|nr:nucleotidyltransferase [Chthonomonadales bacterium]